MCVPIRRPSVMFNLFRMLLMRKLINEISNKETSRKIASPLLRCHHYVHTDDSRYFGYFKGTLFYTADFQRPISCQNP